MRAALLAWLAAVGLPIYVTWLLFPPRPGTDNDMPLLVGLALIVYVAAMVGGAVASAHTRTAWRSLKGVSRWPNA